MKWKPIWRLKQITWGLTIVVYSYVKNLEMMQMNCILFTVSSYSSRSFLSFSSLCWFYRARWQAANGLLWILTVEVWGSPNRCCVSDVLYCTTEKPEHSAALLHLVCYPGSLLDALTLGAERRSKRGSLTESLVPFAQACLLGPAQINWTCDEKPWLLLLFVVSFYG